MFFEPLAEWSFRFTNVCVAAVVVTREVVDDWCSFGVLSLGCTTIGPRVLAGM